MKRSVIVLFCAVVFSFTGIYNSFAYPVTSGAFTGWDADSAVSFSNDGVATLQIQPYDANITSIFLSREFTGVSSFSFDVNFINGSLREVPANDQGYIPNFLQVSFLSTSGVQTDFLGYDKNGVYNPSTLSNLGAYGSWFSMDISNLGGIDGTLNFILQDMGDEYLSQGLVRNFNVTENQSNPVPEPSTVLLLSGGFVAFLIFTARRKQIVASV